MDIEVRRTSLEDDCRADVRALQAAIDDQTIMIAGSAPCFPHGVIDPIAEMSEVALSKDLWLHVDACVGGYIAPFARKLGYPIPDFDFALPGVRSLTADLHKFGHCPKPASTVFYRAAEYHRYQIFDHAEWSGARMVTQTYVGTRPGGGVAAAWAVMNHLGESGYLAITRRIMEMTRQYVEGIRAIDGLEIVGSPALSIITYRSVSDDLQIGNVAEGLREKGWLVSMSRQPPSILLMMSLLHEPVREEYLDDLRQAVVRARRVEGKSTIAVRYS